ACGFPGEAHCAADALVPHAAAPGVADLEIALDVFYDYLASAVRSDPNVVPHPGNTNVARTVFLDSHATAHALDVDLTRTVVADRHAAFHVGDTDPPGAVVYDRDLSHDPLDGDLTRTVRHTH